MPGIGLPELVIVLVILLVIFGPKRLPGLGRSLVSGMREIKDSIAGSKEDDDDRDEHRTALPAAAPAGSVSAEPAAARQPDPAAEPRA